MEEECKTSKLTKTEIFIYFIMFLLWLAVNVHLYEGIATKQNVLEQLLKEESQLDNEVVVVPS